MAKAKSYAKLIAGSPTDKLKALRMWADHWGFTLRRHGTGYVLISRQGDVGRVNFKNQNQIRRWLNKWGRGQLQSK